MDNKLIALKLISDYIKDNNLDRMVVCGGYIGKPLKIVGVTELRVIEDKTITPEEKPQPSVNNCKDNFEEAYRAMD